jgi:hypothetical protein
VKVHLHPDGHAQKGEGRHEDIFRDLFHPGNARTEEIPHDHVDGYDDKLEAKKGACEDGADEVDLV